MSGARRVRTSFDFCAAARRASRSADPIWGMSRSIIYLRMRMLLRICQVLRIEDFLDFPIAAPDHESRRQAEVLPKRKRLDPCAARKEKADRRAARDGGDRAFGLFAQPTGKRGRETLIG